MTRTIKKFCGMMAICLTIGAIVCGGSNAVYAASETETAVAYLVEHGIYTGDNNGNLNLDKSLTRAELAVILTRLDYLDFVYDWEDWGVARFSDPERRYHPFTDITDWALPHLQQRNWTLIKIRRTA